MCQSSVDPSYSAIYTALNVRDVDGSAKTAQDISMTGTWLFVVRTQSFMPSYKKTRSGLRIHKTGTVLFITTPFAPECEYVPISYLTLLTGLQGPFR
jgi:hypothetical protein